MKFIVAALSLAAVALAQVPTPSPEYYALDPIPGTDFVGFGYDARFTEPRNALTLPIMKFAYTIGNTYIYPTDPDVTLRVPDNVYVRTVAYTEADAYLFNTIEEVTMALQISLGFSFSKNESTNNTASTCTTRKNADTNETKTECKSDSHDATGRQLSIGAGISYARNTMNSDNTVIVENSEKTQLYNIFMDSNFIRQEVKDDITALTGFKVSSTDPEDAAVQPQLFFEFIEKYGTHYIVSAVMGGQIKSTSNVRTIIDKSDNALGVGATVTHVSSQDALSAGKSNFEQTISASASFGFDDKNSKVTAESTTNWYLVGGDSNSVNLLDTRNATDAILNWKKTIVKNPVPVAFRLREIGTLFSDFLLRAEMSKAIAIYLSTDTSDIINLVIDLSTGGNKVV